MGPSKVFLQCLCTGLMWPGCDDLGVSTKSFASYEARLAQLERSKHNAALCCGHTHNNVNIQASPNRSGA